MSTENGMTIKQKHWRITLDKSRATWYWFTANPQGGGFGSNQVTSRQAVLERARTNIPSGESYELVVKHDGRVISKAILVR